MTEFGPKEQSRLAELLGDEYGCPCCGRDGDHNVDEPWCRYSYECCKCSGSGRVSGLALIEACRKRGLRFIVDSWPDGGYVIECFIPGTSSRCVIRCNPANLESAIAIAALEGLETVANSESAN